MGKSRFTKPDQTFTQDLSVAALAFTTATNNKPFHLDQVVMNFNVGVSETITITLDSARGASYDTILQEVVMVAEQDYVFRPQGDALFVPGDEIKIECTDTGGVGVCYGVVKTSEIS